jgi:sulfoxide reductase heme-binding subunit YedZ
MAGVTPGIAPGVAAGRGRREAGLGAALLVCGLLIGVLAGPAVNALGGTAADKLFWTGSRITAFLAYLAITGSVCYGLAMTSGILDVLVGKVVSFELHQDLSFAGLTLGISHAILLLGDAKSGYDNLGLLFVPGSSAYRQIPIAAGQLAAWFILALIVGFYLRGRMGVRLWRVTHMFSTLAFVLVTGHGLFSGTDSSNDLIWWAYVALGLLVVFLFAYRVFNRGARAGRPPRPGV